MRENTVDDTHQRFVVQTQKNCNKGGGQACDHDKCLL